MRPWKNPNTTDAQRAKNVRRRIMEERSIAEDIWNMTQPETDVERLVDYVHNREYQVQRRRLEKQGKRGYVYTDKNIGIRTEDHLTSRIMCAVLWPNGFNQGRYPANEAEKYRDHCGRKAVAGVISQARIDERYGFIAILTDMLHEDPDTHDLDNIIFEGRTEKEVKKAENIANLNDDDPRKIWQQRRDRIEATRSQRTQQTLECSVRSEIDNIVFERQDQERRRRRRANRTGGT